MNANPYHRVAAEHGSIPDDAMMPGPLLHPAMGGPVVRRAFPQMEFFSDET